MRSLLLAVALLAVAAQQVQALSREVDIGECKIVDATNSDGRMVKETSECDWDSWSMGLIPNAIPLVLGLLLVGPCCFFFFCGRFCCGCCGGTYPSREYLCCPPKEQPSHSVENPYEPGHIKGCKVCTVILALIAAVGAIVLVVGLTKETSAYDKAFNGAIYTADFMNEKMTSFSVCMKKDPEPAGCAGPTPANATCYKLDYNVPSSVADVTSETDDIKKDVEDAKEDADKYVGKIKPLLFVAGLIPFLVVALGVCAALRNIRKCMPMILMCLSFLFAFIVGTGLTVESVISKVAEEGCPELTKYKDGDTYNLVQVLVDNSCDQKTFDENKQEVEDAMNGGAEAGCQQLLDVCSEQDVYDPINAADKIFWSPICTSSGVMQCKTNGLDWVNNLLNNASDSNAPRAKTGTASAACQSGTATCTVQQCAIDCQNADAKNGSAEAIDKMAEGQAVKACYVTHIEPFLNCYQLFLDAMVEPQLSTCDDLRSGAMMGVAGCSLLFIALVLSLPVQAHGAKIWQPATKSFVHPDEDGLVMDGPEEKTTFQPFL